MKIEEIRIKKALETACFYLCITVFITFSSEFIFYSKFQFTYKNKLSIE